jgi:hypothetical protein
MTPRDFLADDNEAKSSSENINLPPRDFLSDQPNSMQQNPQETFKQAAWKALPRIEEDVYRGGMNVAKSIPGYIKSAETEIPGIINPTNFHPLQRAGQMTAGLAELGHGLLNAPRGIADYLSNRLNLIPQSAAEKIPYQKDISEDLDKLFGQPKYPGDALARGAVRNSLSIIPAGKMVSSLNPMNFTAKNIAKDVLNTADTNKKIYGNLYNHLWKDASNKGFDNAMYNVNLDIPTLKKFSPQKSIKGVIDFDQNPTLQNAHAAKSDLLRMQRDLTRLPTLRTAERQQLKAVSEGIDSINKHMFRDLDGNIDQNMVNKYNAIQKGYANEVIPYKNKAITKFKRNEISANELVNSLSKGEFSAKRGEYHPEIGLRNTLRSNPYLTGLGTGAGLAGISKIIYDNMMGNKGE